MPSVGKYCKVYLVERFREFSAWVEGSMNIRKEKQVIDNQQVEVDRSLADDDYLFLQENYVVTDGIFKDEHIIFGDVTPEWIAFCQQELGFEVPAWARGESAENTGPEI